MNSKNVSGAGQFFILFVRQLYILKSNIKKLLMIILLPVITAVIVGAVSGEDVFVTYEDTKSTLFAIVCVSIWIGLFNSIQEICQERSILKREYMANLRLISYISSKFVVQAILCLIQSAILLWVCGLFIEFPGEGLVTGSFVLDSFISVFLIMLASDALGLFISSLVKSGDIANIIAPVVLILQLVMSGVLFELEGFADTLSNVTFSKWGMECLGSIADMNNLELYMLHYAKDEPTRQTLESVIERKVYDGFTATSEHLIKTWLILLGFCVILILISSVMLRHVAKDSR